MKIWRNQSGPRKKRWRKYLADHAQRGQYLRSLGNTLSHRFDVTNEIDDLHRAIQLFEIALLSASEDDPDRAASSGFLGQALLKRGLTTPSLEDDQRALEVMIASAELTSASPSASIDQCHLAG